MYKKLFALGVITLVTFVSQAQQLISDKIDILPGTSVYNTNCVIYLPAGYDKARRYPLVVYAHGMGEAGTDINKLYLNGLPKVLKDGYIPSFDFIMVAPQRASYSVDPKWLEGIVEESTKRWSIDTNRIYLTGVSAGGWSAYGSQLNITTTLAQKFAAIVALSCATQDANKMNFDWWKTAKTPVWAVVGDADVSYRDQNKYMVNEINKRVSGLASITIRSGVGHTGWNEVYSGMVKNGAKNMWEWLYQFSRGSAATSTVADEITNTITNTAIDTTTKVIADNTNTYTDTATTYPTTSTASTSTTLVSSAIITTTTPTVELDTLTIEAEGYQAQSGVNVGYNAYIIADGKYIYNLHSGDWMDYKVSVPTAGTYTIRYRVLSKSESNHFRLSKDGQVLHTISIPNSMYWNQWNTLSSSVYLNAGEQILRIEALNDDWIIDYFELHASANIDSSTL